MLRAEAFDLEDETLERRDPGPYEQGWSAGRSAGGDRVGEDGRIPAYLHALPVAAARGRRGAAGHGGNGDGGPQPPPASARGSDPGCASRLGERPPREAALQPEDPP